LVLILMLTLPAIPRPRPIGTIPMALVAPHLVWEDAEARSGTEVVHAVLLDQLRGSSEVHVVVLERMRRGEKGEGEERRGGDDGEGGHHFDGVYGGLWLAGVARGCVYD